MGYEESSLQSNRKRQTSSLQSAYRCDPRFSQESGQLAQGHWPREVPDVRGSLYVTTARIATVTFNAIHIVLQSSALSTNIEQTFSPHPRRHR